MVGYPSDCLASCSLIHPCDGRADRRAIAIAYSALSMYAVAR